MHVARKLQSLFVLFHRFKGTFGELLQCLGARRHSEQFVFPEPAWGLFRQWQQWQRLKRGLLRMDSDGPTSVKNNPNMTWTLISCFYCCLELFCDKDKRSIVTSLNPVKRKTISLLMNRVLLITLTLTLQMCCYWGFNLHKKYHV